MTQADWEDILGYRLGKIKRVLDKKAEQYALDGDRLSQFRSAARMRDTTLPQALWGMAMKHLVSVQDIVDGRLEPTPLLVSEKIGDLINYLILLEAVLAETINFKGQYCYEMDRLDEEDRNHIQKGIE